MLNHSIMLRLVNIFDESRSDACARSEVLKFVKIA